MDSFTTPALRWIYKSDARLAFSFHNTTASSPFACYCSINDYRLSQLHSISNLNSMCLGNKPMPSPPPLAPLAGTGFSLFPDQTAQQSTTFLMKEHFSLARLRLDITTNGVLAFTAAEEKRNQYVFRTPSGEEVMRIAKDPHSWSGRGEEFHGLRPDGREVWTCKLRRKLSGTEYCKCLMPGSVRPTDLG